MSDEGEAHSWSVGEAEAPIGVYGMLKTEKDYWEAIGYPLARVTET